MNAFFCNNSCLGIDSFGSYMNTNASGRSPKTVRACSQLQVTLTWQADFWGKNRSAYEGALGAARAADVDAHAAALTLTTSLAQAYVQLQRAFEQRDIVVSTLRDREALLALTRQRTAAGLDSRVELKQAESALPATREQVAGIDERIGLLRNQIAALIGAGPDRGLAITRPALKIASRPGLPSSVPVELLGRRPDLVAQRWRVEAASRNIASAKAEFYPNVNLLLFVGLQSLSGGNLLTAASRMGGAGPAVTLPIFDGGRLRANLAGRDAAYDIAVGEYNQGLAYAMRDVVDQLVSMRSVDALRVDAAHRHELVDDVAHRVGEPLVVFADGDVVVGIATGQVRAQSSAVEYRQRHRRTCATHTARGGQQVATRKTLQSHEQQQVDVRVELRLRRSDVARRRLDPPALRDQVGPASQQFDRHTRRQTGARRDFQCGTRDRKPAVGTRADQCGDLLAQQPDALVDAGHLLARCGKRRFSLLQLDA